MFTQGSFVADWAFELECTKAGTTEEQEKFECDIFYAGERAEEIAKELTINPKVQQSVDIGADCEMQEVRMRFQGKKASSFVTLQQVCEILQKKFKVAKGGSVHSHCGMHPKVHDMSWKSGRESRFLNLNEHTLPCRINILGTFEFRGGWSDTRYENIATWVLLSVLVAKHLYLRYTLKEPIVDVQEFIELQFKLKENMLKCPFDFST